MGWKRWILVRDKDVVEMEEKGRIRVDAAIFKGSITPLQGVFTQSTLQNEFIVSTFKPVYKGPLEGTQNVSVIRSCTFI